MTALVRRIMSGRGHNDDRSLVLTVKSLIACAFEADDRINDLAENVSVRGVESLGTKLITRMPIFDRASTLIYYTRRLC